MHGQDVTEISYPAVALKRHLHPAIVKQLLNETFLRLGLHIAAPHRIQVSTHARLQAAGSCVPMPRQGMLDAPLDSTPDSPLVPALTMAVTSNGSTPQTSLLYASWPISLSCDVLAVQHVGVSFPVTTFTLNICCLKDMSPWSADAAQRRWFQKNSVQPQHLHDPAMAGSGGSCIKPVATGHGITYTML